MSYVATRGGEEAIRKAENLFQEWVNGLRPEFIGALEEGLPLLLDRIMGEASLYAPSLAALALAQAGGDLYEAILLLRAYRSTLPRVAYAEPIRPEGMITLRRVSAAFKDVPGGQVLGPTLDYSPRLLRLEALGEAVSPQVVPPDPEPLPHPLPPVSAWLRGTGLLPPAEAETPGYRIPDLTRQALVFPSPRAMRLQALARADTGGMLSLAYANMRGYGAVHPTVNELRLGYAEVRVRHPVTGVSFSVGRVRYSYAEVVSRNVEADGGYPLALGFAATLGWNETKVIAGAVLDLAMNLREPHPAHTEEFVLLHTDPVEAHGFCIHYKLPHYVMFLSALERIRKTHPSRGTEEA